MPPPPQPLARAPFINAYDSNSTKLAPSAFGKPSNYSDELAKNREDWVATDRPLKIQPDVPVVLLCGVFRQFLDEILTRAPSTDDCVVTNELRELLAQIYPDEAHRRDAFNEAINNYVEGTSKALSRLSQWDIS